MAIIDEVVKVATREWEFFGKQEYDLQRSRIRKGRSEIDDGFWQRVGQYWRDGTGKNLTGKNDDFPWSAAFISYVMRHAGASGRFKYSAQHSVYIRAAIIAKERANKAYGFWGYRLSEFAPKVGDLVCYAREPGISYDTQSSDYKSHADIVIDVKPGVIKVIGGNVGNSVSSKSVKTNARGVVADSNEAWFAVLENRMDIKD